MNLKLEGKVALVTGASRGIGKKISEVLDSEGVKVYGISRTEDKIDLSTYVGLDEAKKIIREIKPSILINNVGGGGRRPGSIESYEDTWNRNCRPMVELTYEFLKHIHPAEPNRIITIASIYGKESGLNPWFTSAKAYQIAFMKEMASAYRHSKITFNTISPGEIDVGKVQRLGYFGDTEDVANLVAYLCSEKAKHINGANIVVDGGESYSF